MKHMKLRFDPMLKKDLSEWTSGWAYFAERHLRAFGFRFESRKDILVDLLMARRGSYQRPFLHISLILLIVTGVSSAPILANAYSGRSTQEITPPSAVLTSLDLSSAIQTEVSEKPRDQVITYTVRSGDTFSKIADQFGVSIDTIKWANDTKDDSLTVGDKLKIPPVTGIVHKVQDGDTIYSIAKKYRSDAQNIVNFPFNEFADADTFALSVGQTIIVPGGVMPEAAPPAPVYTILPAQHAVVGSGQFLWPTNGMITQYPSWYHMAFDIANPSGPAIMAADAGVVSFVGFQQYGYGLHIMIDHGNGYVTLYGHTQAVYVKQGDHVAKGQVIGKMGSTGRSTGTHLHFEIRKNGVLQNPQDYFHV